MKFVPKICFVLFIALITASAVSATSNSALPSYVEANNYITSANITAPGYADKLATSIKTDHPAWYFDLWKDGNAKVISVYFSDHKSVYYDDEGKIISPAQGLLCVENYKGVAGGNESSVTNSAINNSTVTNTTTENSCPNCQQTQTSTVTVSNNSSLTTEQQKQLDDFMSYFDGKEEVTIDGIKEQAIKSFFGGN